MSLNPLYLGCDMEVWYSRAMANKQYLNSATVTWELRLCGGGTLSSGVCLLQPGNKGTYRGVIESTVTSGLGEGVLCDLIIVVKQGEIDDYRRIGMVAKYRSIS